GEARDPKAPARVAAAAGDAPVVPVLPTAPPDDVPARAERATREAAVPDVSPHPAAAANPGALAPLPDGTNTAAGAAGAEPSIPTVAGAAAASRIAIDADAKPIDR